MEPSEPPVLPMPKPIAKIRKGSKFVFMPNGDHLFVAASERAWMASLSTSELLFEFEKPARFVREIAISGDGEIAAIAQTCGRVTLYEANTGKKIFSRKVGSETDVSGLAFAPGSHDLLHATWQGLTAIQTDTHTLRPICTSPAWPDNVSYYAIAFSATGDRLAYSWRSHTTTDITLLAWPSGAETQRLSWKMENWQPHSGDQLRFAPDSQSLLLTGPEGTLAVHSLTDSESERAEISLLAEVTAAETAPRFFVSDVCFSPDGLLLAYKLNGILGLWAWPSGKCLGKWKASEPEPYFDYMGFSSSGREFLISFGGSPSGIFVYRTADFINSDLG